MPLRHAVIAVAALGLLSSSPALAQPQQQPLVQPGNLVYLGNFSLPATDGTGRGTAEGSLLSGGAAVGLGPDGQSLYYGCHDWGARLARVTIPTLGGQGTVVEPCAPIANLAGINPGDPNSKKLGGSLWWNGRLTVSAYSYYDGNGTALASHFVGGNVASQVGPYRVGAALKPGMVAGYMGAVPQEWRTLLGGPALTGQCCIAVIARSSFGPSVSVFNPDDVGTGSAAPATLLLGYPETNQTFGPWNVPNPYFTGVTRVGGVAFPAGTRSVLFIGRHGTTFCYGTGTGNAALAGTPDGQGNVYCYDPFDGSKGSHGYPYKHQIWAYDAVDLLAVKQGAKQAWDVLPYAVWDLNEMGGNNGGASMRSAAYDPATRRWYVVLDNADSTPTVHVYEVTNAVLQPPVPGPVGFAAQPSASGASLLWFPPAASGLTGYRLEVGSSPGGADISVLPLSASTRSLPLPAGISGTFYFRLLALYADGTSGASGELAVTLGGGGGAAAPASPTNLRAVVNGGNLVISWDPPADGSVVTVVADVGSASGTANLAAAAPLGKFGPFVVANAPAGSYYIRLRAVSAGGVSAPSNEVRVAVGGGGGKGGPPPPPTGLTATVDAGRVVKLVWHLDENGPDTAGFSLEVGAQPGGVEYGTLPVKAETISAGPVPPGTYYIRVRAWNGMATSAPGNEVRVVVP